MPKDPTSILDYPQVRNLDQISVTTTEAYSDHLGTKYVFLTTGDVDVQIAFTFKRAEKKKQTSLITQPANTTYKYTSPPDFKLWRVFHKVASGTSTLDVLASEIDIEEV